MDISDAELVDALLQRFGRQARRAHIAQGRCRYEAAYPNGACPWCQALQPSPASDGAGSAS